MGAENRLQAIDIARGIAMLCIVLGHLGVGMVNRVVYTFHVPVFFIITGYFLSEKQSLQGFIQRKTKTLLIPYLFTCVVIIILGSVIGYALYGASEGTNTFTKWVLASLYGAGSAGKNLWNAPAIGAIWFLWATFWGSIFLKLSLKWNEPLRAIWVMVLFIAGYWSAKYIWLPWSIQAGCCATAYMYVGYLCKKLQHQWNSVSLRNKHIVTCMATVVWLILVYQYKGLYLVSCRFGNGALSIVGSLCGCYLLILLSGYIEKCSILVEPLSFLGRYSIFMLCFHLIEMNLIDWRAIGGVIMQFGPPAWIVWPVLVLIKFGIIITFTVWASKNQTMRKMFGM